MRLVFTIKHQVKGASKKNCKCAEELLLGPQPCKHRLVLLSNTKQSHSRLFYFRQSFIFFPLFLKYYFELDVVLLCVKLLGKTNATYWFWWQQALADARPWRWLWQILAALESPWRILAEWIQKGVQVLVASLIDRVCSSSHKKLRRGMKHGNLYLVTTVLLPFLQAWEASSPLSSLGWGRGSHKLVL